MVNAGSTSLKVAIFDDGPSVEPTWSRSVDGRAIGDDRAAGFRHVLASAPDIGGVAVVGHRVVHGGRRFDRPVVIDAEVEAAIAALEELAPLHNRAALDGIAAARAVVGAGVAHVAMFDTTFHRSLPPSAAAYGGPFEWIEQGLRRYGFHGISHQHAAETAAAILGRPLRSLRLVTCHLGGGCSLAAVDGGRSVDTTMGFTPLDGVVMATRSGAVDPGLVLHLLRSGVPVDDLQHLLEEGSGLLGLSGVSSDLREVIVARDAGHERAALAVDVFVHRIVAGVGAMVAALGGIDAIVFTGGIGEHSAEVRSRVGGRFAFLGAVIDEERNQADPFDADVSAPGAATRIIIVRAREELAIARSAFAAARVGFATTTAKGANVSDGQDHNVELVAQLESLSRADCLALLAGTSVGRIGLLVDGRPEILPVNYALDGEVVLFRTGIGTVMNQAALAVVAFEADTFDEAGRSGWSVLVQGVAQDIGDAIDYNSERLRELDLVTWAPGTRDRWFSIRPDKITGRRIKLVPAGG